MTPEIRAWLEAFPTRGLLETLGIRIVEAEPARVVATMPVGTPVHQPFGLLHGGASVALAETLGSIGAALQVDVRKKACVGLEINANHLKGVRDGYVIGRATALHVGRSTQVWEIRISHEETGVLVCVSRITMAVVDVPASSAPAA